MKMTLATAMGLQESDVSVYVRGGYDVLVPSIVIVQDASSTMTTNTPGLSDEDNGGDGLLSSLPSRLSNALSNFVSHTVASAYSHTHNVMLTGDRSGSRVGHDVITGTPTSSASSSPSASGFHTLDTYALSVGFNCSYVTSTTASSSSPSSPSQSVSPSELLIQTSTLPSTASLMGDNIQAVAVEEVSYEN